MELKLLKHAVEKVFVSLSMKDSIRTRRGNPLAGKKKKHKIVTGKV